MVFFEDFQCISNMFRALVILAVLSSIAAVQYNVNPLGIWKKRILSTAIFGDSTSDTGNVYQLTNKAWPISPPNYHGRYSNGFNWADTLEVLVKYNYAHGSATTDNNLVKGYAQAGAVLVPGLLQQVEEYVNNPLLSLFRNCSAHIIWGGANDAVADPTLAAQRQVVVASLIKSVSALLAAGDKDLIVFNQVLFQIIPVNAKLNQSALFIQLTAAVNYLTNAYLQGLKQAYPNANIYLFDVHTLVSNLYANPPSPINDVTGYCWAVTGTTISSACNNPNNYFFADTFHFTTPVQQKLAKAVGKFFDNDFTPSAENFFYKI